MGRAVDTSADPFYKDLVFRFPPLTPTVKKALIVFAVAFLVEVLLDNWLHVGVVPLIALETGRISFRTLWQPITYVFAQPIEPSALLGLIINLLFFWLIISPFEELYGPRRTMLLMVVSTLAASLPAVAVGLFLRPGVLYGLSPIILGGITAFAWAMRGRGKLSLFGVFPMTGMQLIYLILGFSFLFFLLSKNFVSLVADLGAIGGGILLMEWIVKPPSRRKGPKRKAKPGKMRVIRGGRDNDPPHWLN